MKTKYESQSKELDNLLRIIKDQFQSPENLKEFLDEMELKKQKYNNK